MANNKAARRRTQARKAAQRAHKAKQRCPHYRRQHAATGSASIATAVALSGVLGAQHLLDPRKDKAP